MKLELYLAGLMRNNFGIGLIIIVITLIGSRVFAEKSLAEIVRNRAENSKVQAQANKSKAAVPEFSEDSKNKVEKNLNSMQVGVQVNQLKNKGSELREKELKDNPDGSIATMVEATDIKKVKGFEKYSELEMFKRSDLYMQDPVSQMGLINEENCKEQISNKKKGFFRKDNKVTVTDEIEELRSCEVPLSKFKCEKSLEVSCKKTTECDYGGITKDSLDKDMLFDVSNGFFTVGVDCDNCLSGTCATHERKVVFSIAEAHLITSFHLVHVKFDDYIQITLNDHIVYVGPDGGNFIEVKKHEVEIEKERTIYVKKFRGGAYRRVSENEKYKENITLTEVFNGNKYEKCERDTNWDRQVNVDLKKYLVEGKNTLKMKIIVSGNGEGWLKIKAMKQCCANNDWTKTWVEHCEQN